MNTETKKHAYYQTLQMVGDNMAPTINDGDLLQIDPTQNSFNREGIYLFEIDGSSFISRVERKLSGNYRMIYDNPLYQPCDIPSDLPIKVMGEAIHVLSGKAV